jgi:hypothetical protein
MEPLWKLMEFSEVENIVSPGIDPICGWDWVIKQKGKVYPEQGITVFFDGKALVNMPSTSTKRGVMTSAMKMARGSKNKEV